MDEAVSVAVAKAVRLAIEAAQMGSLTTRDFVLERSYAEWNLELSNLDKAELSDEEKLRVDVVSHTTEQTAELSSRTSLQYMVPIDIAVRRKFGTDKQDLTTGRIKIEEIDALILLVQELHVLLTKLRTTDEVQAVWQSSAILAAPVREHLKDMRQFTGILRVIFRADVKLVDANDG